jgi:F0F1-type ATP synthase assembly protein I
MEFCIFFIVLKSSISDIYRFLKLVGSSTFVLPNLIFVVFIFRNIKDLMY